MNSEKARSASAGQVNVVIRTAAEHFTDALQEKLRAKGVELSFEETRNTEDMFVQAVRSWVVAESAAFLGLALYAEFNNEDMLRRVAPAWLAKVEASTGQAPDVLLAKVADLPAKAGKSLEKQHQRSPLVNALLTDLAAGNMTPLQSSYYAVLLSLLGE